jgi:hypothetical protein
MAEGTEPTATAEANLELSSTELGKPRRGTDSDRAFNVRPWSVHVLFAFSATTTEFHYAAYTGDAATLLALLPRGLFKQPTDQVTGKAHVT